MAPFSLFPLEDFAAGYILCGMPPSDIYILLLHFKNEARFLGRRESFGNCDFVMFPDPLLSLV
jgi:hypothetical protein